MKVLNLYAGIGGNRKLWTDVDVTAVEIDERIAAIYQDFFPNDKMIIGDAHQYLLEHFKEYDFIWSSPPCPTHSRFKFLHNAEVENKTQKYEYPDMTLWQEIIFLRSWFRGKYCVENVIIYYKPLILPTESNSHYFWTNFNIKKYPNEKRGIRGQERNFRINRIGFDLSKYNISSQLKKKIMNNCVEPELGLHILNCARGVMEDENKEQLKLFSYDTSNNNNEVKPGI